MKRTLAQLNPKIKYLVDECVSFKCTGLTKRNAIKSSEIFPPGTPDDEILKFIQKHGLHLITADIRFALKTAMIEKRADYFTQEGERYRLRGKFIAPNYFTKIYKLTDYCQSNDMIVIP